MPPSQLKRLKASLRENGITGPQKSKKAKKQQKGYGVDQRAQRQNALADLREEFNPFEVKAASRPRKFAVTTNRPEGDKVLGRPGVSKSVGEETRRKTLLPELYRRNKAGGIVDRRIGENDPTMTPEDRMLQRFTREKARKKGTVFDLEDGEDEEGRLLTHGGKALVYDNVGKVADDFGDESVDNTSNDEEGEERDGLRLKRSRHEIGEEMDDDDSKEQPERKKTKAEVMKEVIAKSKLHKYERQQAKEEDDDLRERLNKDMPDLIALIRGHPVSKQEPEPSNAAASNSDFFMNPDRAALLAGMDTEAADKEYDMRLRQMIMDKRAKPTTRTKTEEEKAQDEASRLKELEDKRQRRMRGEEEESEDEAPTKEKDSLDEEELFDEAAQFGLRNTDLPQQPQRTRPEGVDDEDDFILEDDLVASESDLDEFDDENDSTYSQEENEEPDEDYEFVQGQYTKESDAKESAVPQLAFSYPCPQTHAEFLNIIREVAFTDVPTVIQRIRALHAPQLALGNKEKLGNFSSVLVDHIAHMAQTNPPAPLVVLESVIRHIHSLSRTYPEVIGTAFRSHVQKLHESKAPSPGSLVILTAISTIYPTSDHFHQVATPAMTLMARWLGLTNPQSIQDHSIGAYLVALSLKYQTISKRYVPEAVRFTLLALKEPHITSTLQSAHVKNLLSMAELWASKSAFAEIFAPAALSTLKSTPGQKSALQKLKIMLDAARQARRPLELHHHKPIAIKTFVPKFEESFDPTKHYDPDKERSDAAKLRAEYKKERKGAMRELRKDANFVARQQLKDKKEKDRAYEEKYRKLVASIQAEEGQQANEYDREKRARKSKR